MVLTSLYIKIRMLIKNIQCRRLPLPSHTTDWSRYQTFEYFWCLFFLLFAFFKIITSSFALFIIYLLTYDLLYYSWTRTQ